jgi:hypothetical protein
VTYYSNTESVLKWRRYATNIVAKAYDNRLQAKGKGMKSTSQIIKISLPNKYCKEIWKTTTVVQFSSKVDTITNCRV